MGLGALLTRNLVYDVTNTQTGDTAQYTLVTDGGPGMFADWSGTGSDPYRGLMSIPAAWRGILLLSGLLGRIPFQAFREVAGRPSVKLEPQPSLLVSPNGDEIALNTHRSWGIDRIAHGNAIGLVAARGSDGWPTGAIGVQAGSVQVKRVTSTDRAAGFEIGEIAYSINSRWYHAVDVIHFKGPCPPGALRGLGVLEIHWETLDRSRRLDEQAGRVDASGVPTGLLKTLDPDTTQDDADDLKAAWLASQRTRTVAVLNPGVEFEPIAWSPSDIQLMEMRAWSINEWSNILGVDPMYLGGENSSRVYANIEDKGIDMLRYGAAGDLIAEWEQTLSRHTPRGIRIKANLDAQLRADTAARYQTHAVGIAAGFLTPNEARELEERAPLTPDQQAEIAAARPPAASGQSTAPAGKGTPTSPGSGAPKLTAVRGLIERLEPLAALTGRDDGPMLDDGAPADLARELDPYESTAWALDVGSGEPFDHIFADRAADADGSNLHTYWTKGPGLAKWASSPRPWRTLRRFLSKYLSGHKLDATTSAWYRDVFGHLPGQQ